MKDATYHKLVPYFTMKRQVIVAALFFSSLLWALFTSSLILDLIFAVVAVFFMVYQWYRISMECKKKEMDITKKVWAGVKNDLFS